MKLVVAYLFAFIALSMASSKVHFRGCFYIMGKCVRECEEGTHAYMPDASGCGHILPEPTCDVPNPVKEDAIICDYSACYCDPPTVRDTTTNKCVPLEMCPKKVEETSNDHKRVSRGVNKLF